MADPAADTADLATAPANAEELLGLSPELVLNVSQALDDDHPFEVQQLIEPLHCAELADLIQLLRPERRAKLVEYLRPRFDPEMLTELEDTIRDEVAAQLGTAALARAIAKLESDDALLLISTLEEGKQRQVLHAIPEALRNLLEEGLSFPEDSAGRLMQRDFVAVPAFWTVGETIDFMRESDDLPTDFYDIFVVDPRHRAIGIVALSHVLRSKRPVRISDIMDAEIFPIPATMDQEDVAWVVKQHDLVSAPVVDDAGRLIGAITIDDIVDVIHEEAEEDIMRLGGVREGDLYSAVVDTSRSRFSWLAVNLLTAISASIVIGFFEGTLQQVVILAVLMPIVASMGGNAGTQTMTVAVRAIATKELTSSNALRVLSKEVLVGLINGLLFAVLIGAVAWFWSGSPGIGAVMAASMVITLVAAGFAGALIPLFLARIGVDPAIGSAVILTTITDVVAFAVFLGLAAWFLL
ncbi:MAG: magnesium transporter [Alphaproteobacteria bacterium]|nr:magnesium transporter [Alphaproteobacteria bacterium]